MNTKAETLSQLEARGRLFATTLLDAGFSASEVRDAAFGPAMRLDKVDTSFSPDFTSFRKAVVIYRQMAGRTGRLGPAFVAGVLAVIEERA